MQRLLLSLPLIILLLQNNSAWGLALTLTQVVEPPVKPISPSSKPVPPPTEGEVNLDGEQPAPPPAQGENENEAEPAEPVDPEQAEQESDSVVPKTEQNPFGKPDIDQLIQKQFNDDMWRIMRGGLPCLETSAACLQQLQDLAVAQSPLLKEIDTRIAEANERVNEAKARNKKSIQLSVLTPALQYLLGPATTPGQPQNRGFLDNIAGIFRGDTGIINALLNVVGVPLFQGISGGNEQAQQRAILISDIQVKIAELQRGRAELAEKTREKVAIALVKFDEARTDFQTSQIVASRAFQQFQIFELRYVRGNSDTESYLARQNQMDNTKAQVYGSWAKMRRALFEIKLLVLSVKDAEI